jgi:hypothetical protein
MMRELFSEIMIDAAAETVWRVLTDFDLYPSWNPFIRCIRGRPDAGARLEVRIQPPAGPGMVLHPRVLKAEPNREFRWCGRLLLPGIFDGEHIFTVGTIDDERVRFVQREEFRGFLAGILWRYMSGNTLRGFHEMNRALKERAEYMERYGPVPIAGGAHRLPGDGSGAEAIHR